MQPVLLEEEIPRGGCRLGEEEALESNHTSGLSYLPCKVTISWQTVLYPSPAALKTRALVQSAASLTNTDDLLKFRRPARAPLISSSRRSWLMLLLAFQGYAMVDTSVKIEEIAGSKCA